MHIPFCVRKCAYCDFLSFAAGKEEQEAYVQALIREISSWKGKEERSVSSVFFGGGTPSVLAGGQLARVLGALRESFFIDEDAEVTMECNPGTLDEEKAAVCRAAGFNRISFGLQSADDRELAMLGRIHTLSRFEESCSIARKAGFSNINVDLISALPGQTPASWKKTLKKVLEYAPEHISAYSLIIEEGTPFYQLYGEDAKRREAGQTTCLLPSEEAEREMYEDTLSILQKAGYERYEISNYAKPGFSCRHNIGYWERQDYLGFGLGAASLYRGQRFSNTRNREDYLTCDFAKKENRLEVQRLSIQDQMEETMFLGLRMTRGVSLEEFEQQFQKSCAEVYGPVIEKLKGQELLKEARGRLFLTARGLDVANYCMAEFLF